MRFLFSLASAVALPAYYTRYVEPFDLELHEEYVQIGLENPIRLLHLSDLHASDIVPYSFIARAVRLGLAQNPDLICLTGDYISDHLEGAETYSNILRPLSAAAPTYASFGNHDGGSWSARRGGFPTLDAMRKVLHDAKIQTLENASEVIEIAGNKLEIAGLGDLWAGELKPWRVLKPSSEKVLPTILLSHNPDSKDKLGAYHWDLMLSGHTHGGQIRLPIIGAPYAPVKDRRYVDGLCAWQDRHIYITRGVGNMLGFRLNCRPQVSLLTLT